VLGHKPLQPSPWNNHPARRGGGGRNGRSSRLFQDLPTKDGPSADILHKNSYYYNQGNNENVDRGKVCEWEACQARFLTVKELHRHVHDRHLSRLPVSNVGTGAGSGGGGDRQGRSAMLYCHWRHCSDSNLYSARYKLMLHLQRAHFDKIEEADRDRVGCCVGGGQGILHYHIFSTSHFSTYLGFPDLNFFYSFYNAMDTSSNNKNEVT